MQAIADGKKLECRWHDRDEWRAFDPLDNGVVIEHIFKENFIFRLAPAMITVGGVSFPKPVLKPLEDVDEYWVADPTFIDYALASQWVGDKLDELALSRGLLHKSKEDAIAHAKALIKLSGGNVDG